MRRNALPTTDRPTGATRHAFVNCTDCGPRFTIIGSLPYDRAGTAVASSRCAPTAPASTPILTIADFMPNPSVVRIAVQHWSFETAVAGETHLESGLQLARKLLRSGGVLAVKGIGGYHLACDAANPTAVAELQKPKKRPRQTIRGDGGEPGGRSPSCRVDEAAAGGCSRSAAAHSFAAAAAGCASHRLGSAPCPDLGIMLAYSPVHVLLFGLPGDEPGPPVLVMTSGNLSGEPIAFSDDDAFGPARPTCRWLAVAQREI